MDNPLIDYVIRTDGEGFEVPSGEIYLLACCDCGLVHEIVLVSHDGLPIGMAARVNDKYTADRRKEIGNSTIIPGPGPEPDPEIPDIHSV